ncbi:MAG TPA: serine hydrolase domain-containing protein [Candidatus Solibacter sp.]|nr:serine hydrolase domain-containing protein [Candidatus Solibacter sp.]
MMRRRNFLQTSALALIGLTHRGLAIPAEAKGTIHPPSKKFLATLPHLMELAKLPGLGIGVVDNGKMSWQHYAGVSSAATKAPIAPDSLFPAASMGKQPFAYGVILLAQQGKLDLDKPLREYLADGAPTGKWSEKITARHVLSHSSGLPNWRWNKEQELTPAFEPGTKFRYSGEGFYFLQRCVEHITGMGAEQWMQDQVLKPLGMTSSTYLWNANADAHIVAGHQGDEPSYNTEFAKQLFSKIQASGKPLAVWHHEEIVAAMLKDKPPGTTLLPNDISPNAAFSLLTTVADYSAFLANVVSQHSELTSVMRGAISKPISHINSALGWGLGFGVEQEGSQPRYLWQWGDNGGWKNFFLAHLETQSAIAVFTNGENGMHINERVMRAATGEDQAAFMWV